MSDPEIVAGLLRGERGAAEQLYDRIHLAVERSLRRVLRHQQGELDDMMQASFERIIRVLSERPLGGECNLPAWASAVAANVALDTLRRRQRERRLFRIEAEAEVFADGSRGPEHDASARGEVARLQGVLASMRPDQAEAVLLHDVLGHELTEIAAITGVSVAAAQSRLVRGRKDLLRRARLRGVGP